MAIDVQEIMKIFHPIAYEKTTLLVNQNKRFVHYTSAEAAISILDDEKVWMRKSTCMNDFMEAEHGWECLQSIFDDKNEIGTYFCGLLDSIHVGISNEILGLINSWNPILRRDCYITCVSEHEDSEDGVGRLSMWRAYGKAKTGVALVLNPKAFLSESDALRAYTTPVYYSTNDAFSDYFKKINHNIADNLHTIKELDRLTLTTHLFAMLRLVIHGTKHIGFAEEKEWRVIYCPQLDQSERIEKIIRTINGVPQPICTIPLKDVPDEDFLGASIPELLDRIIIGPTEYPSAVQEAFIDILTQKGVKDAHTKVVVSDIPLRETSI